MSPAARVKKFFRRFGILIARIALFFVLLVVLGTGTVYVVFKTMATPESLKALVVSQLQEVFRRPVQIGDVRIVFYQGIRVRDLKVLEAPGYPGREFIYSDVVLAKYRWRALLRRRLEINEVQLVNPRIQIIRGADGAWNLTDIFVSSTSVQTVPSAGSFLLPVSMAVDVVSIDHGDIAVEDLSRGKKYTVRDLSLQAKGFDLHDPFRLTASFESSADLGGPWPVRARVGLRGSMALADLRWEEASFTADRLQVSVDNQSAYGSGSVGNFRRPELALRLKLPRLDSTMLMRYGRVPRSLVVPAGQWRLSAAAEGERRYRLKSLEGVSGTMHVRASAELDASQWPPRFRLNAAAPPAPMTQWSEVWQGWAKYHMIGMGSGRISLSGALDGKASSVSIDEMSVKVDGFSGVFFGNQALAKVSAELRGSDQFEALDLDVHRGGAVLYQNALSDIDMSVHIRRRDLDLDHLNFTWKAAHVKLKGRVKNLSSPKAVMLDGFVDKMNLDETIAAAAHLAEQIRPQSVQRPMQGPWSRIFKYSIPRSFPATYGRLRVGELVHPNFDSFNWEVLWDLRGVSTGLRRANGNIRIGFGPGRVADIPALEQTNNILRVVFLPFVFMHRLNNLTVISAATAYPKDLDFNRVYGDYGLRNGVVDVRVFHVDSPQLQAYADGMVDFPKEKIRLHMLTRMNHARGSLPEYLTDENGRPSIGFYVEDDLNKPAIRIDVHKMGKDAIEKAVQDASHKSRVVFPAFSSMK